MSIRSRRGAGEAEVEGKGEEEKMRINRRTLRRRGR